jgi:phosphatidylinositol glycan class S
MVPDYSCLSSSFAIAIDDKLGRRKGALSRATYPTHTLTWHHQICSPVFPLHIKIDTQSLSKTDSEALIRSTQYAFDDSNDFNAYHLRISALDNTNTALTVRLRASQDIDTASSQLVPHSRFLEVHYPSHTSDYTLAHTIANKLQEVFAEEQALLAQLVSPSDFASVSERLSPDAVTKIARRTSRAMRYAPTYHLTFSLLTATAHPSAWNIEEAARQSLDPLLAALSQVSNFTLDSQVLPFAVLPPTIQPQYSESDSTWSLRAEDLGGFINAAEWPLSPSIGTGPTINFVLYIPPPSQTPLLIDGSSTNSWIIPQWGSVAILNPAASSELHHNQELSADDLEPIMLNFGTQLLSLLGVPDTPTSSLGLRLSTLVRIRAASQLLSASSTLGSLARLVATLPSIPIPTTVAASVESTLLHLDSACTAFRAGDFQDALAHARIADIEAEKAFFERSMVGQVYFPDEHKVAVYLPLMGPMAVPLVMSMLKEVVPWIKNLKKR